MTTATQFWMLESEWAVIEVADPRRLDPRGAVGESEQEPPKG